MHIEKWWKDVGGSDDTLLMLDYFKANKREKYGLTNYYCNLGKQID